MLDKRVSFYSFGLGHGGDIQRKIKEGEEEEGKG